MVDQLIAWSIRWRLFIVLLALGLVGAGIYAAIALPIDAVPDVTTNQVQINAVAPAFTPLEMEQYVTSPIEVAMSSLPRKEEIRSISQFGLSQVTIVFPDDADLYAARQLVLERLRDVERDLPPGVAPDLAPISTGLGEIYQFTVEDVTGHNRYSLMERRTLLDWFIKPQLRTVPGVIEVNSFGGEEQQYEVLVDPAKLTGYGLSLRQVIDALSQNNINVGGAYLEHGGEQELIRGVGLIQSERDIGNVVLTSHQGTPVFVSSVAEVRRGAQIRQGAATRDGKGETVMGIAMMLKGENSRAVAQRVSDRLQQVQKALPVGVKIEPFYNRGTLVDRTILTASRNLIEGGLVVMAVLFLFLFQIRAGLIVSSAIPLAMLAAIIGMRYFGISANLMSLGAIDFGLVVDAAVIIVENCVRRLAEKRHELGRALSGEERRGTIREASVEVRRAGQVGEILIIAAYLPIVSLAGIEGKMFRPMAFTVIFALAGALVLSLTLIPALSALILREPRRTSKAGPQETAFEADNPIVRFVRRLYAPLLRIAMRHRRLTAVASVLFVVGCGALFPYLGAEFLPKLDEGAIAINVNRLPSVAPLRSRANDNVVGAGRARVPRDGYRCQPNRQARNCNGPDGAEHGRYLCFLEAANRVEDSKQPRGTRLQDGRPPQGVAYAGILFFATNRVSHAGTNRGHRGPLRRGDQDLRRRFGHASRTGRQNGTDPGEGRRRRRREGSADQRTADAASEDQSGGNCSVRNQRRRRSVTHSDSYCWDRSNTGARRLQAVWTSCPLDSRGPADRAGF